MCCFSQQVDRVSNTRIFARMSNAVDQYLAYSMYLEAKDKLAMILPLPVAPGSGENAVKFINLEKYPDLFHDLERGFPRPRVFDGGKEAMAVAPPMILKVVKVGAFDASFVPTIADFSRLDERFRLPENVWSKLPAYANFGFAVFKLRPRSVEVHPMAFSFPTAHPEKLFFPTLHIHDGEIHAKEEFDHILYCQGAGLNLSHWTESPGIASQFAGIDRAKGLLLADHHVYRKELRGLLVNGDVTARAGRLVA